MFNKSFNLTLKHNMGCKVCAVLVCIMAICTFLRGENPIPNVLRSLGEKHYNQTCEETKRGIAASKNENEVLEQTMLGISRGLLVRKQTTIVEVRSVFANRLQLASQSKVNHNQVYTVKFAIKYHFYDDYKTKKQVLKGGAYWVLYMDFSKEGLLEDFRLTCR